jgi:Malectin domain
VAARPRFASVLALVLSSAAVLAVTPQVASAAGFAQAVVPSAVPATNTPDVKNGVVYSIGQVGTTTLLGGTFTSVAPHAGTAVAHKSIVAFNSSTGVLTSTFAPKLDGEVDAIIPGPGNTAYIAGTFTHVNGKAMHVGLVDVTTGALVTTWKPPTMDAGTTSLRVADGLLFVGGNFTTVGTSSLSGLVALNPTTGAFSPYVNLNVAGHHGQGSQQGAIGVKAFDIDPTGTHLVAIGSFTSVTDPTGTYSRDQVFRMNLGATSATVDQSWTTQAYTAQCFNWAFDSYIRDVQFDPTGTYFVIAATGGSGTNNDGTRSLCDSAARWETTDSGSDVQPTWVDYTGQDSLWSVAVTGTAIYVGGHQRWENNSNGFDQAGAGAVPRPGLAALDPANGLPLAWNPGRNPRGAGAYAILATSTGLWVGSDTDWIGNHKYKHQKVAMFPLAGGVAPASTSTPSLPGTVFETGQFANSHPEVLYRIDAGGPALQAIDGGPDWLGDTSDPSPYRNSGSNSAGWSPVPTVDGTVPASTPSAIFDSERWDPGSHLDGNEMHWDFPVPSGTTVQVRLYFANRYTGTSGVGQRVFDVGVDGTTVLPNFDIVAAAGDQTGTMRSFTETSTGDITIDLTHEVENPLINGIEIVQTNPPPPPPTTGDKLLSRHLDTAGNVGSTNTVDSGSIMPWSTVRGAFMVGGQMYYGLSNGNFYKRSFNGTSFGAQVTVDPYDDPTWQNIQTGSGQTYASIKSGYYTELPNVTSAFFSHGRLYYTLFGQSQMYYRYFTPDSGTVGSQEFTVNDGLDWSNTAGAFLSGSTLYYATKSDGVLHSIAWSTDHATGSPTTVDASQNWAGHGLFATSD